jgi:hypothetical protein
VHWERDMSAQRIMTTIIDTQDIEPNAKKSTCVAECRMDTPWCPHFRLLHNQASDLGPWAPWVISK